MASPTPAPAPGSSSQHKFQAPKGTRDFYPADMAVRRHIESIWRQTSINHGFEEVEGPMFEHTELYTHKSGPGIVSEIFGVFSGKDEAERAELQKTGRAPYALRPEFTPTLARMVAARADALPKPIKWFAIPQHFRAERPQRGRLREFMQWNIDIVGAEDSVEARAEADAEVIAVLINSLQRFGLSPADVKARISSRVMLPWLLQKCGVVPDKLSDAYVYLDRRAKLPVDRADSEVKLLGLDVHTFDELCRLLTRRFRDGAPLIPPANPISLAEKKYAAFVNEGYAFNDVGLLLEQLRNRGIESWCEVDFSIVRGLAYYTGTVFEIIAEGERAIAGGGRYDKLIESFGGPSMPACGFGMGDVVLGLLLKEKGLLKDEDIMRPLSPDAFIISSGAEVAEKEFRPLVARLRRAGLHIRHSYKSTKNIGKLLGEADKAHARFAVILDDALSGGVVKLKDLRGGEQREIRLDELEASLRECTR